MRENQDLNSRTHLWLYLYHSAFLRNFPGGGGWGGEG